MTTDAIADMISARTSAKSGMDRAFAMGTPRASKEPMLLRTLIYLPDQAFLQPEDLALDSPTTLVLAFGASHYDSESRPLRDLRAAFPQAHLLGCSTAGEIHGTRISDGSVVVALVRFEHTRIKTASTAVETSGGSFAAGERLGRELLAPDLHGVFVLSDGLNVNGSELVRGIHGVVGDRAVVTGGLAGDGDRFKRTWVMHRGVAEAGIVAAVGLYGSRVRIGHGSKGGWDIFGPERTITRSKGNVLYELDGKPALQLYKEYLGERAAGLPATALLFPLALRARGDSDVKVVRTVLAVDEREQSLTFAGDMPQSSLAQLMRANFDRLVQGASDAALMALSGVTTGPLPVLSIAISCVGRRLVLGERTEEETEATLEVLPAAVQQVGFYSYGEISPYAGGGCELHNQTMTLTTFSEA